MVDGSLLGNLALGFQVALSWQALLYALLGVSVGTFVGVLPGTGIMATIAMLMPLTFHLDPTVGLIMLAGIYYGAAYGGSTASILLNIPGTPQTAVTALDGYPMARQGRAGVALFITKIASLFGSLFGIALLVLLSPVLVSVARSFGAQEYFALMLAGLLSAALLTSGRPFRAIAMVFAGLLLGIVGTDINTGTQRFTYGVYGLYDGLSLVAVALGLFGIPEIVANATRRSGGGEVQGVSLRSLLPTRADWRRAHAPFWRGSAIGALLGTLPGTGAMLATFISYAVERRVSRTPQAFGSGMIEGVAAPEAANNAAIQTAFIPTLTLGVPGDAVMALMLGAMFVHGIAPGPNLMTERPDLFWGLSASFLIGNAMLLVLNIPLIGLWVRVLTIPYQILFPAIVVFICIGVYSINYSALDVLILALFGAIGYAMRLLRFEVAPLVLGMVLGPLLESNLRRSMLLSRGDPLTFFEKPMSAAIMGALILVVAYVILRSLQQRRRRRA